MTRSKSLPLLQAKLYRPTVGRLFVERPRLNEQLSRGLDGPLTLVCAPSGFGKTTTVSAWIESLNAETGVSEPMLSAWLTLDERDGDLATFVRYLIAALRTIFPGVCGETAELLKASTGPGLDLLSATLSNEIAALPAPFVIVVDDNATAENRAGYELLSVLLHHWPPPMHLVLIGRREPPMPLANLRAKGQLAEVRTGDLRFTRAEIESYIALRLPERHDRALLEQLEDATEGWITGLHLIIRRMVMADAPEIEEVGYGRSIANVTDYLFDEVLAAQPEPVRAFLLQTAILARFNASLAAAVIGHESPGCDAQECIAWLEGADLFVSPQDDWGTWYGCHPLFQEYLLKRMRTTYNTEQVNRLHERAAGWFAGQGETDEAIHHALAAGNLDLAAWSVERGIGDVLNRDDPPTLQRWLRLLPEALIHRRPGLLLLKAWVLQFSWQFDAQARIVDEVAALLAGDEGRAPVELDYDPASIRGQMALIRAQQAFWTNQPPRAIALCQEALALLPREWTYARGGAVLYEGLAMWMRGDGEGVTQLLSKRYEALDNKTDYFALRHLMALCLIWRQAGKLERLRQTAQVMLEQAQRGSSANMRNWAQYFIGVVHYERGELAEATAPFSYLVGQQYTIFMALLHDSFALMALVTQAQGGADEAMQLANQLTRLDLERTGDESDRSRALRARLQLRAGDVEAAGRWADTFTPAVPDSPLLWIENPHLTRARILIARNRDDDAITALNLLDAVYDLAARAHATPVRIETLALRALALSGMQRQDEALDALREALKLCLPGDFTRIFVDLGPPMKAMLRRLALEGVATETIRRTLAAFSRPDSDAAGDGHNAGRARAAVKGNQALIEPLTARELEILELLRKNLSAKEIGSQLFLSPLTVKRHAANIYGKLGVNRRADAVEQAEMLGLLPRD